MTGKHGLSYTALLASATLFAFGASPLLAQAPEPASDSIDEITVKGRQLRRLRAEVMRAQEDLYSLINEHVDDPKFHVTCRFERPSFDALDPRASTRIKERVCRSEYMRDELQNIAYFARRGVTYDATPRLANGGRAYSETVAQAINEHPELREAAERFDRLQAGYWAAREARSARSGGE